MNSRLDILAYRSSHNRLICSLASMSELSLKWLVKSTFFSSLEYLSRVLTLNISTVYLTGNYIGESPGFLTDDIETKFITTQVYPGGDGSGFDSDEEEGAYMLDEVSSDVEVDPSEFLGMESESDEEGGG
jgi:hypothetical protein